MHIFGSNFSEITQTLAKNSLNLVTAYDSYSATNTCTAWQHKISVKLAVTAVLVTGTEKTNEIVRLPAIGDVIKTETCLHPRPACLLVFRVW